MTLLNVTKDMFFFSSINGLQIHGTSISNLQCIYESIELCTYCIDVPWEIASEYKLSLEHGKLTPPPISEDSSFKQWKNYSSLQRFVFVPIQSTSVSPNALSIVKWHFTVDSDLWTVFMNTIPSQCQQQKLCVVVRLRVCTKHKIPELTKFLGLYWLLQVHFGPLPITTKRFHFYYSMLKPCTTI